MGLVNLLIKIGCDTTDVTLAAKRVESAFTGIGSSIKGQVAAFFSVAIVAQQLKAAVDYAGQLTDQMKRLGVSSEFLQGWAHGLRLSGASAEELTGFIEKLSVSRDGAMSGDKGALAAFKEFGITAKELQSSDIEGLARKIAAVFTTGNPQEFVASLRALGGKSAGALIPAFVENIEDAEEEARKLGLIVDKETRVAVDKLGDSFTTNGVKMKVFFTNLVAGAISTEEKIVSLLKATIDFGQELGRQGADDPSKFGNREPLSKVAHDALISRYKREREGGSGVIGSAGMALGDFIKAHFTYGGTGPGSQISSALKAGKNAYALDQAMNAAALAKAMASEITPPGSPGQGFGLGIFGKDPDLKTWLDSEKEKKKAADPLLFRSSNPDAGAAGGAFYFGADRGARLDLGRQAVDLQRQTLKEIQSANAKLTTITAP